MVVHFPHGLYEFPIVRSYQRVWAPHWGNSQLRPAAEWKKLVQQGSMKPATQRSTMFWTQKMGPKKAWWKVCLKNWASRRNDPHMFKTLEVFEVWGWKMWRYTWRISGEKMARCLNRLETHVLPSTTRRFKFAYVFLAGFWNANLLRHKGPQLRKKNLLP